MADLYLNLNGVNADTLGFTEEAQIDDSTIVQKYWDREENAIAATSEKYGACCLSFNRYKRNRAWLAKVRQITYNSSGGNRMERSMIKRKRNELGLSQKELADMSGVNFRLLQDYEQGRKKLLHAKSEMLYRLSTALDCSMESLLEYEVMEIEDEYVAKEHLLQRMMVYSNSLKKPEDVGSVGIWIDALVPCLVNVENGKEEDTVVFRIESRSYLQKFHSGNGWHINWSKLNKEIEVYALALTKDNSIQGLIAVRNDIVSRAAYIHWACAAPHNNKAETGIQKYSGVGGHLFAIAAQRSFDWGYRGVMHGFASCEKVLQHYIENLHAVYLGTMHQFHFYMDENESRRIMEVYRYEWDQAAIL